MKNKAFLLSVAVLVFGCADDGGKTGAEVQSCDATYVSVCDSEVSYAMCLGGQVRSVRCPDGMKCQNGACVVMPSAGCFPNGMSCDGNVQVMCAGGVETRTECPGGCVAGRCVEAAECDFDGSRCDGPSLLTCAGGQLTRQTCPNGCSDSKCVPDETGCAFEGSRCEGNELVTCASGVESRRPCAHGCVNDHCAEPGPDEPVAAECGNGILEDGELCDGRSLGSMTCYDVAGASAHKGYKGAPECNATCDGVNWGSCEETDCGDHIVEPAAGEICDFDRDGVAMFGSANPSCSDIPGYSGLQWLEGGRPGCSSDCKGYKLGTCRLAPQPQGGIEMCEFSALVQDDVSHTLSGTARIIPVEGAGYENIKGALVCGNREFATYTWGDKGTARFKDCIGCKDGEYELVADISYGVKTPGIYDCVFQARVNTLGDNSTSYYNCPVRYGYPHPEGIPSEELIRTYEVKASPLAGTVLAHWDFAGYSKNDSAKSVKASDGVSASQSSLSLSDGSAMTMVTNGNLGNMAVNASGWSEEGVLSLENSKYYAITTRTTGYKDIRLRFVVAGSSDKIEKHVAVAVNVLGMVFPVGEELVISDARVFHEFPLTPVPNAEDQSKVEIRIYGYNMASGTTLRLDDIYITGDPK